MRPELQKKIDQSIRLLKSYDNTDEPVEIAYSGGKDIDRESATIINGIEGDTMTHWMPIPEV